MILRLIVTYLLVLLDLYFTKRLVSQFGIGIEGNPIGKWILEKKWREIVFKLILPGVALVVIGVLNGNIASYIVFFAYLLLNFYHLYIISKLYEK